MFSDVSLAFTFSAASAEYGRRAKKGEKGRQVSFNTCSEMRKAAADHLGAAVVACIGGSSRSHLDAVILN